MRVRLSIGEPWDFTSPDGQGVLLGIIDAYGAGSTNGRSWVVMESTPFFIDNLHIHSLLVTSRQALPPETDLLNLLQQGLEINVNAAWRDNGSVWDPKLVDFARNTGNLVGGWLIGGLTKYDG